MANLIYKHGVYSEKESSEFNSSLTDIGTVPVYVGDLPINRLNVNGASDFDYSPYINKPILVNSYNDVSSLYSGDWKGFSLCEAIYAHFLNGSSVQSPIILINIFDPKKMLEEEATTIEVQLLTEGSTKVGYIEDSIAVIDGIALSVEGGSPELTAVDFNVAYEGEKVKITITKSGMEAVSKVTATYKKKKLEADATAFQKGLDAIDYCELATGYIPNILAAPSYSEIPEIHEKMIAKAVSKISDKWNLICVSDIPCDVEVNTLESAKEWKNTNNYNNKLDKVCYPKVIQGSNIFHLSTITAYMMQKVDTSNDGVPYVSPSNKALFADAAVLDDGTQIYISETQANDLNAVGITTVNIIKRGLRLWGSHMANYNFEKLDSIDAEDRGDANVRMMLYLLNFLQYNFIDDIDTSFTRKDVDSILISVQQWLNSLVNEGKILYAQVTFNDSENSTESMINGDFVFNVESTLTPNAKSITFKLKYTTEGLSLLTDTGGNE